MGSSWQLQVCLACVYVSVWRVRVRVCVCVYVSHLVVSPDGGHLAVSGVFGVCVCECLACKCACVRMRVCVAPGSVS